MKKILVSAFTALAMVAGGFAAPALATVPASNTGAVMMNGNESGPLSSPSLTIPSGTTGASIYARYVPTSTAWNALKNSSHVFTFGGNPTKDGAAFGGYLDFTAFGGGSQYLSPTSQTPTSVTVTLPNENVGSASFQISLFANSWVGGGMGGPNAVVTPGTYAFTPALSIDGVPVNPSDYTVTYSFSMYWPDNIGSFTALSDTNYVNKTAFTCVNTTGFSATDVLTITSVNNGTAGYTTGSNRLLTTKLSKAELNTSSPTALVSSESTTGQFTYALTANEVNTLLVLSAAYRGTKNSSGADTLDISVTRNGTEVTVPCYTGAPAAPTVTRSGTSATLTVSDVAVSGMAALYKTECYADPTVMVNGMGWAAPATASNGSCTLTGLTASASYNFYYSVRVRGAGVYVNYVFSANVTGAGSGSSQVSVSTPVVTVPVFKQPKFAMPSKIDVDATGKVSLSGKDMGVSTVLIGGKEQKIDTNSDEKLVFDTTGLAKGVHDLVMKGAFGTYTIQKAIQVGEAVVTKVAGVSARQVGMAGGELSISGVGLEGTTQITMNGQVLEILSKTDSKVTFKVPASTVASVNSIMIEGSFVPVLFKNAFSYTK